jgi:hypothetical protein
MRSALNKVTVPAAMSSGMKEHGRYGDTEMAHVTPGEIVVPHSVQTPKVKKVLRDEFANKGTQMEQYTVQSTQNNRNPETGNTEYFSLGSIVSGIGKAVKTVAPIAGTVATMATGNPMFAMAGNAVGGMGGQQSAGQQQGAPSAMGGQQGGAQQSNLNIRPDYTTTKISIDKDTGKPLLSSSVDTSAPDVSMAGYPFRSIPAEYENAAMMLMADNPNTGYQQFFDRSNLPVMRKNPFTGRPEYFDAAWYLKQNPDVASHPQYGSTAGAYQHYLKYGKSEGRAGDPPSATTKPASTSTIASIKTPVAASAMSQAANSSNPLASTNAANQKLIEAVQSGAITDAEANAILKQAGFNDAAGAGGGRAASYLNSNPTASTAVMNLLTQKTASPVPAQNNQYNQQFINAVRSGQISDADANLIFKDVGFSNSAGAGGDRVNNYFNANPTAGLSAVNTLNAKINAAKPTSIAQTESVPDWGKQLQDQVTANNSALSSLTTSSSSPTTTSSSADSTLTASEAAPEIATRTSSLSPQRSPRFRSQRYEGGAIARNF